MGEEASGQVSCAEIDAMLNSTLSFIRQRRQIMVVKALIEARWKAIICGLLSLALCDPDYNTPELHGSCDPPRMG
jgi:hypothetical protein